MPYMIKKQDSKFCVYKHDGDGKSIGESLGCHDTRQGATGQMRAVYASENAKKDAGAKVVRFSQSDALYVPVSVTTGEACAGCRWFKHGDWGDDCQLVDGWPMPIEETGWCQMFESIPVYQAQPMQVEVVAVAPDAADMLAGSAEKKDDDAPVTRQTVKDLIGAAFRQFVGALGGEKDNEPLTSAFKVRGNHWFAVWSNNFKDREGEIFTEKAIDQYVARVDAGLVPKPELWFWHSGKDFRIGQAEMVGRHGHFSVAMGTWDDTPKGVAARKYYGKHARDTSLSHGFTYHPRSFKDGVYHDFNTFEISLLPRGVEANRYTTLQGVKAMADKQLSEDKRKAIIEVFGEQSLTELDSAGKALEDIRVQFKDFGHVEPEAAVEPDTATNDQAVKTLLAELIGAQDESLQAVLTAGKAMTAEKAARVELEAKFATLQKAFDDLRAEVDLRPRSASKDAATLVSEGHPILAQSQVGLSAEAEAAKEALPGLFKD